MATSFYKNSGLESKRSKRNANPEPKKKKKKKFKKYHKQLKIKDDDDDEKSNSPQGNLEMLSSITEKLKEQLVSDMNHKKANSDKQKSNFIPNSILKKDSDGKINNDTSKAVPPIHLVKQITEEIYNNLDNHYPLHKPALNSRVTVIRARPGEEDKFLPIQHAPIQVRLNKKTGEYQIRYTNKNEDRNGAGAVRFVNGSVHEDKEKRKKLWQQFDEKLRNIRAGVASPMKVASIPVTTASASHEKSTRKKRRRVVKKIVRVRRRRTTPEPVAYDVKAIEEISEVSDKQIFVSSESKTKETGEISDIKGKGKKKTKADTKRQKVGRKRKVTETPVITSTDVYKDKMKPDESIKTVPNTTRIHKTYSEAVVSSSEEEKSTYFTSEKPVHILITHVSPPQSNISTSKIPLSSIIKTSFTVTPKPMLVTTTTELPQNHEYRNIMTTSFKADLRKEISYSTYLYSKYHSISTARSPVTTACLPTTVITEQQSKTAVTLETSDEFLMSSNESTERPPFAATSNTVEPLEFTTPIVPPNISKGTEESEIDRTTKSLESSEDLGDHTITEPVKSSKQVLTSTRRESLKAAKDLKTVSWRTSIEESHRSLETLKKTLKDNTTLIASTLSTIIGGIKNFTSEYSTGKPTQYSSVISEQATLITSASTGWPTMSEIRTEIIEQPTKTSTESQSAMETTEQTTLLWRRLPTIVFKVYSTLSSTPYARSIKSKHSNIHGEGLYKSGWYRYQSYPSRNFGSRYKPYPPVTSKPRWDKQRIRYNGRYGRNRKHGPPKYTWQHGDYHVPRMASVDVPESAIPMPIAVSTEDTSLVEVETSTVKMKLVEEDMLPTSYDEQYTTLSFNEEQQTTVVAITEIGYEKLSKEDLISSSPMIKENDTTLVTDSHAHVSSSSSLTHEKTIEPSETYIISQTSVEKEDIISSTSYPKFLTTLLLQEQHTHHVPEYTSITTASEIKDMTLSMEHKRFKTAGSLPVDRHTVQTPFIKTHLTLLDTLEHTTRHSISEKHTTESFLPTAQQTQRTVEELYTSESSCEVDTITIWTPYTVTPSTQSYTTLPTTVPTTVKEVYTTSEPLPQRLAVPKEVSSYKGPKFEWPIFDIKNILTTVSPLLGILSRSTLSHQIHEVIVTSETPKLEVSTVKHVDSSIMDKLHDTGKSVTTEPTILTEKIYITNQSTISSVETTAVSPDHLTVMPTEDENSLLKVVPDTDLVSSEEGVLKKIFVNPFKAVNKYFKDSFESESQEKKHYINYDEPNDTAEYDFNDIYNEPYFDKNATDAHFTVMRFKGTYVTVRTIYRRPSNFTFPPTPPLTKKPTTQPPVTTIKATRKPEKLGLFGFMKHRAKKAFKNIVDFFSPDLSDEEEEIRRMRKNVMVEEEEDEDDEH